MVLALKNKTITIREVAEACDVTPSCATGWIVRGVRGERLGAVRVGGRWRVTQAALDKFLAAINAPEPQRRR